jgi:hypothetical protein
MERAKLTTLAGERAQHGQRQDHVLIFARLKVSRIRSATPQRKPTISL